MTFRRGRQTRKRVSEQNESRDTVTYRTFVTWHQSPVQPKGRIQLISAMHAPQYGTLNPIVENHLRELLDPHVPLLTEMRNPQFLPVDHVQRALNLERPVIRRAMAAAHTQTRERDWESKVASSVAEGKEAPELPLTPAQCRSAHRQMNDAIRASLAMEKVTGRQGRYRGEIVKGAQSRNNQSWYDLRERAHGFAADLGEHRVNVWPTAMAFSGLVAGLRSFLMTAEILRQAREHHALQVVVGTGHGEHIAAFLNHPEFYRRYGEYALNATQHLPNELQFLRAEIRRALAQAPPASRAA